MNEDENETRTSAAKVLRLRDEENSERRRGKERPQRLEDLFRDNMSRQDVVRAHIEARK